MITTTTVTSVVSSGRVDDDHRDSSDDSYDDDDDNDSKRHLSVSSFNNDKRPETLDLPSMLSLKELLCGTGPTVHAATLVHS